MSKLRFQLDKICKALYNFHDTCDDHTIVTDCESISNELTTLMFVLLLFIEYKFPFHVQRLREFWQKADSNVTNTVTHFWQFYDWLEQYYSTEFYSALKEPLNLQESANMMFIRHSQKIEQVTYKRHSIIKMLMNLLQIQKKISG